MNEKFVQENAKLINGTISTKYGVRSGFLVFNATATLLEKPAYNQQYLVHAPSHEDPL